MLFYKGHTLERSRSQVKRIGTIIFLDLKIIDLDTEIVILSALVQKLGSKTIFCQMVDNVMCSCASHLQTIQDIIFIYLKAFIQATFFKIWQRFAH